MAIRHFRTRLKRSHRGRWCLRVLWLLVFVAVFGDFIANEKPLWCRIDGRHHFPVAREILVDLGLASYPAGLANVEWRELEMEAVIWPPIPYSASTIDLANGGYRSPFAPQRVQSWRWRHWLGTDRLGRDVLAGLVAGTRVAMLVGLIAMAVATCIGMLLGSLAGYFGDDGLRVSPLAFALSLAGLAAGCFYLFLTPLQWGWGLLLLLSLPSLGAWLGARWQERLGWHRHFCVPTDLLVMRAIEVMNALPGLLLLLAIVAVLERNSIFYVMVVIGLLRWTGIARFLRAELLKIRRLNYIEAGRAMGFSEWRLLFRHALPNALGPVLITVAFGIASAILLESVLSFLGIGVSPDTVTWGSMLSLARQNPAAWWLAVFPGLAIFVTVTLFNLLGDALSEK